MTAPVPMDDRQQEIDNLHDRIRMLEGFALDHGHERCARVIEAAQEFVESVKAGDSGIALGQAEMDLDNALDALDATPEVAS